MNKYLILLCILSFCTLSNAQIKGVTETGEEVLLFEGGTWKYANDSLNKPSIEIVTNDEVFKKAESATFLVKSAKTNVGVWIDPKEWSFNKAEKSSAAEYIFKIKERDIYAMLIPERMEITNEGLIEVAIQNAYKVASDLEVMHKEYRNVNGLDLIMMQLNGTIQGVKFVYLGYYFSDADGAFQVVAYTSQNAFEESKKQMEELINGFVKL